MEANKLSVLLVEPGKTPKMIKIDDSLEAMQALVRGPIEVFSPFNDDVVIICNEEGKISGLPLNRASWFLSTLFEDFHLKFPLNLALDLIEKEGLLREKHHPQPAVTGHTCC